MTCNEMTLYGIIALLVCIWAIWMHSKGQEDLDVDQEPETKEDNNQTPKGDGYGNI